jgi:hypothetical protein
LEISLVSFKGFVENLKGYLGYILVGFLDKDWIFPVEYKFHPRACIYNNYMCSGREMSARGERGAGHPLGGWSLCVVRTLLLWGCLCVSLHMCVSMVGVGMVVPSTAVAMKTTCSIPVLDATTGFEHGHGLENVPGYSLGQVGPEGGGACAGIRLWSVGRYIFVY